MSSIKSTLICWLLMINLVVTTTLLGQNLKTREDRPRYFPKAVLSNSNVGMSDAIEALLGDFLYRMHEPSFLDSLSNHNLRSYRLTWYSPWADPVVVRIVIDNSLGSNIITKISSPRGMLV